MIFNQDYDISRNLAKYNSIIKIFLIITFEIWHWTNLILLKKSQTIIVSLNSDKSIPVFWRSTQAHPRREILVTDPYT